MIKKLVTGILVVLLHQLVLAKDYIHGKKIELGNGEYGDVQLQLNDDGTYMALIRKLGGHFDENGGQGPILCETKKLGYWEENTGELLLWGMGKGKLNSCFDNRNCLELNIDKIVSVVGGSTVLFELVTDGSLLPIESMPTCE